MKNVILATVLVFFAATAFAQQAPQFLRDTYPTHALKQALDAQAALQGNDAQLDATTRELISLGVAAQIPCIYCVYAHTMNARALGASEAEIVDRVSLGSGDDVVGAHGRLGRDHRIDLGGLAGDFGSRTDVGLDEDVGGDGHVARLQPTTGGSLCRRPRPVSRTPGDGE